MKTLKERMRALMSTLKGRGRDSRSVLKPKQIDFDPPPEWLTESQPTPLNPAGGGRTPKSRTSAQAAETVPTKPPSQPFVIPSLAFTPRFERAQLPEMPDWCDIGRSLQHPKHQKQGATALSARIGLDFGTAFTKVAIRVGNSIEVVDWSFCTGDDSEEGRYLVPGLIARTHNGEFCWNRHISTDLVGNLKLPVIETARKDDCPMATVAFLALVIRYARAFLYRQTEIGRTLMRRSLRWELNIGCPTKPFDDIAVVESFRRIARTAWVLAAKDRLSEQDVLNAWSSVDSAIGLESEPAVHPEFVAQIAGYINSPQAREGLHALIDIGAATLDVATFNIVLKGDGTSPPRIPIFFSRVDPLGTHFLRDRRYRGLGLEPSWNDAAPLESAEEFAIKIGKSPPRVEEIDADFLKEVVFRTVNTCDATRTNSRGDTRSRAWQEGLPIFITGGGSKSELYRRAIAAVEKELKSRMAATSRFRFIELDATAGIARTDSAVDRLTVALGLTEDPDEIARIIPNRYIERNTPPVRERLDHTELYSER